MGYFLTISTNSISIQSPSMWKPYVHNIVMVCYFMEPKMLENTFRPNVKNELFISFFQSISLDQYGMNARSF